VDRRRLDDLLSEREVLGRPYLEFVRTDAMSAGIYVLPATGTDLQSPHKEDELYLVVRGHGRFTAGDETVDAAPGDTIYVKAGVVHRFHDIVEELVLAVVFAPPET
jgi:mannose-6-phosphate isomerase-like protein (cupin superfamily)